MTQTPTTLREQIQELNDADHDHSLVGVPNHPAAATAGAVVGGAAAGAVVGTAAGPVGTAIGAVVGAVAGALGGDAIASSVEQVRDAEHWRQKFADRPYLAGERFDEFVPAFEYGHGSRQQHRDRSFDAAEAELARGWDETRGAAGLEWSRARPAVRDAWGEEIEPGRRP